jgi:hypothetical protein
MLKKIRRNILLVNMKRERDCNDITQTERQNENGIVPCTT